MAVPRGKRTKSHKKQRALHLGLEAKELTVCPKCKKPVLPHHACSFCGIYAQKEILSLKTKKGKSQKGKKGETEKSKGDKSVKS